MITIYHDRSHERCFNQLKNRLNRQMTGRYNTPMMRKKNPMGVKICTTKYTTPKNKRYLKFIIQCSFPPPRLPPFHPLSRTLHFAKSSPAERRIITVQHPLLTLIRLTECISPLFPHPLHLPHFPDRLLELLHPRSVVLNVVLLDLLHVMIGLRSVHALGVLP